MSLAEADDIFTKLMGGRGRTAARVHPAKRAEASENLRLLIGFGGSAYLFAARIEDPPKSLRADVGSLDLRTALRGFSAQLGRPRCENRLTEVGQANGSGHILMVGPCPPGRVNTSRRSTTVPFSARLSPGSAQKLEPASKGPRDVAERDKDTAPAGMVTFPTAG